MELRPVSSMQLPAWPMPAGKHFLWETQAPLLGSVANHTPNSGGMKGQVCTKQPQNRY